MTPPFVTPYAFGISDNCKSTRQLLAKIPNVPCLYRHTVNGIYYGEKKIGRKRKEHSLGTTDRKLAERRLKLWIDDLDRIDAKAAKITLAALLDKFLAANPTFARFAGLAFFSRASR